MMDRVTFLLEDINTEAQISKLLIDVSQCGQSTSGFEFDMNLTPPLNPKGVINLIGLSTKVYEITNNPIKLVNMCTSHYEYITRLFSGQINTIVLDDNTVKDTIYDESYYKDINSSKLYILRSPSDHALLVKNTRQLLDAAYSGKDKAKISKIFTVILELTSNCIEHSSIDQHDTTTYFMFENKIERDKVSSIVTCMSFSIGDFGMGITKNLRCHNPTYPQNDSECIKKALEIGITGRQNKSGGAGFSWVQEILEKINGYFQISSGDTVITINDRMLEEKRSIYLPGTQFHITINL